jgi:hypothetical protein
MYYNFTPEQIQHLSLSKGAAKMLKAQQILLKIANENQLKRDTENIERKTPPYITVFPPNSYVLVGYPDTGMGTKPPDKLMTNLRGPLRVINTVGPSYTLLNLVNNEREVVHVKRLKPFLFDPDRVDPIDVANRDETFFQVHKILTHRGDFNRKKTLEFLVQWEGCPESDNLWLPWKELRTNEFLHKYLWNNNLQKHIPKNLL